MDLSIGCEHPVRVAGMCAICGIAVDDHAPDSPESSSQLHDFSGVQISTAEAARLDSESTRHLLSNRKLALIVDLDQTIIHATVDPTVGDWKNDPDNPNFRALNSVGKFRLGTDGKAISDDNVNGIGSGSDDKSGDTSLHQNEEGCWYYVKPRPGLETFLHKMSTKYEMHVYTMGTRSYAESVCKLLDPKGINFGARIMSRDENGSLLQKSLSKLFPMDTSMVVIIDDRADVWKWSPNLVKVIPFDFFVGIGDINASFLPAAPSETAPSTTAQEADKEIPGKAQSNDDRDVAQGTIDGAKESPTLKSEEADVRKKEAEATAVAESSQRTTVSEQLGSRPLAKMQEALDVKNDEQKSLKARIDTAVLHDNDKELQRLQDILDNIHLRWYTQWDGLPLDHEKPATMTIIASLKSKALQDCVIVFSSIFPLQQRPESSDLWRLAAEFGATCKKDIDDTVTHVVAGKGDTHKVLLAQKKNIYVVWPAWLHTSCAAWYQQPEESYLLPKSILKAGESSDSGQFSSESDQFLTSFDSSLPEEEEEEEDQGFGEMNWDEANDEVDAVLDGLTDDDTADEGYTTDGSVSNPRKRVRSARSSGGGNQRDEEEEEEEDDDDDDEGKDGNESTTLSPLSKRRKMAGERVGLSKLKNAVSLNGDSKEQSIDGGDTDDDFLKAFENELEQQLAGSGEDGQEQEEEEDEEGLATDDE